MRAGVSFRGLHRKRAAALQASLIGISLLTCGLHADTGFTADARFDRQPDPSPDLLFVLPPSALIVSIDGVQKSTLERALIWAEKDATGGPLPCWEYRDEVEFAYDTGDIDGDGQPIYTCMPNLYREFTFIDSRTCDGKTMTKPQHVCMMTGLTQEQSGVTANVSGTPIPEGSSVFAIVANHFDPVPAGTEHGYLPLRTSMVSWKRFVGRPLSRWAESSRALQFQKGHGAQIHSPTDHTIDIWDEMADDEEPSQAILSFVHYKSVDWAGHLSGSASPGYFRHLIFADAEIGRLIGELDARGWGHAAMIVTTDHGFPESASQHATRSGSGAPQENFSISDTWIALRKHHAYRLADRVVEGETLRTAEVTDIVPTILDVLNVPKPDHLVGASLLLR